MKTLFLYFWSLDEVVGDLRNHVRSLDVSENLQLVRACKRDKNDYKMVPYLTHVRIQILHKTP